MYIIEFIIHSINDVYIILNCQSIISLDHNNTADKYIKLSNLKRNCINNFTNKNIIWVNIMLKFKNIVNIMLKL
jgi:hypothetical protein